VIAYSGVDTTGFHVVPVKYPSQAEGQEGELSVVMGTLGPFGQDRFVAAIAVAAEQEIAIQPGADYTKRASTSVSKPGGVTLFLQTIDAEQTTLEPSWTWSPAPGTHAIALAVSVTARKDPPPPLNQQEKLARLAAWIEPVLRLHESEAQRPMDPAVFWGAHKWTVNPPPADDKQRWGGQADVPFPRSPEPFGTPATGPDWFLEVGGWLDYDGNNEAEVTAQSQNRFGCVVDSDGDSWYDFEFFNTEQLLELESESGAVLDLTPLIKSVPNAMLLCYYYFFPYHRQSAGGGLTNIEAKMLASHVGDWQCIAIMLGGPGDYPTTDDDPIPPTLPPPVFVGCTGLRPAANPDGTYPPYHFDEESRTVMKVTQWDQLSGPSAGLPDAVDVIASRLPVFYVADGTHSIYLIPGPHDVDPFPPDQQPQVDGSFDAPVPLDPADPRKSDAWAFLLKVGLGGLIMTFLLAAAVEASPESSGSNELDQRRAAGGDPTPSAADQTATPGQGPIVVPGWAARDDASRAILAVQLGCAPGDIEVWRWSRVPGWTLDDGPIGNPDMVVDRSTQDWWPAQNRLRGGGFTGRWGQNVTLDPLARRAGPRFPEYWRLFLLALEDGKTKKAFDFPFE
jgi:hypothetical protein